MRLIVLGSGSAGNATLLYWQGETVLIDAGLSPRRVHRACRDLDLPRPSRILLTHPDSDHLYRSWSTWTNRGEVRLHLHADHVGHAEAAGFHHSAMDTFNDTCRIGGIDVDVHLTAHDDHGTCAFVIHVGETRIGWATDLGSVPDALLEAFERIDVLAIESNYDRGMQEASDRPFFLKQRIMGGSGHLSNRQALHAACAIADRAPLQQIVLLHLSRQCNCPGLIADLWAAEAPHLVDRLTLTTQHAPTPLGVLNASAN